MCRRFLSGVMIMSGIIFLIIVISIFAVIIGCVEWIDNRESVRYKRLLEESVRCSGVVKQIERRRISEGGSPYRWRVYIEFEYAGKKHCIAEKSVSKPNYVLGDRIAVLVDIQDPDQSRAKIE